MKISDSKPDFLYAPEAIELLPWADKLQNKGQPPPPSSTNSPDEEGNDLPAEGGEHS